jgi:hypothetical protein
MAELPDPRQEAFAHAKARGLSARAAAREAGYARDGENGSKVARRPHVAARVVELAAENAELERAGLAPTIIELARLARLGEKLKTPAAVREARLARVEAHQLYERLRPALDPVAEARKWDELSNDEWLLLYAPPSPT